MHEVAGRTLPLRIVENDRARRLTLRIDAGGQGLRITVPPGLAAREVDRFLAPASGLAGAAPRQGAGAAAGAARHQIPLRGVPHLIVHEPGRRGTVTRFRGRDRSGR